MHHFRLLIYFLSYTWSLKCGQLQDWKTWVGVYVKCYCFSIFVVVGSVYYKYQYRITYTLCCGLNRLQVYVTEIKEKQIFERIQVANMSTFWVRFLQIRSACGWMSDRCCGHFGSQRGRQYVMTPKFVGSWIYLYTMNWKLTMVTGITAYKLEVIIWIITQFT